MSTYRLAGQLRRAGAAASSGGNVSLRLFITNLSRGSLFLLTTPSSSRMIANVRRLQI